MAFRDALRADHDAREAYSAVELAAANASGEDRAAYTDAKAEVIADILTSVGVSLAKPKDSRTLRPTGSGRYRVSAGRCHRPLPEVARATLTRWPALHRATMSYMPKSTSYRLSDTNRERLARQAEREGVTATALLDRLITEGIDAIDHPGIVHQGPPHDRRAAIAGGPDVWEIIARLRELDGTEEARIRVLADETDLHPRSIRTALDYAAANPAAITARIEANDQAIRDAQETAQARQALLA